MRLLACSHASPHRCDGSARARGRRRPARQAGQQEVRAGRGPPGRGASSSCRACGRRAAVAGRGRATGRARVPRGVRGHGRGRGRGRGRLRLQGRGHVGLPAGAGEQGPAVGCVGDARPGTGRPGDAGHWPGRHAVGAAAAAGEAEAAGAAAEPGRGSGHERGRPGHAHACGRAALGARRAAAQAGSAGLHHLPEECAHGVRLLRGGQEQREQRQPAGLVGCVHGAAACHVRLRSRHTWWKRSSRGSRPSMPCRDAL